MVRAVRGAPSLGTLEKAPQGALERMGLHWLLGGGKKDLLEPEPSGKISVSP